MQAYYVQSSHKKIASGGQKCLWGGSEYFVMGEDDPLLGEEGFPVPPILDSPAMLWILWTTQGRDEYFIENGNNYCQMKLQNKRFFLIH